MAQQYDRRTYTERMGMCVRELVSRSEKETQLTRVMKSFLKREEIEKIDEVSELKGEHLGNKKLADLLVFKEKEIEKALAMWLCKSDGAVEAFYRSSKMGAADLGLEHVKTHLMLIYNDGWLAALPKDYFVASETQPESTRERVVVSFVMFKGKDEVWIRKENVEYRELPYVNLHIPKVTDAHKIIYGAFIETNKFDRKVFPFTQTQFYMSEFNFQKQLYLLVSPMDLAKEKALVWNYTNIKYEHLLNNDKWLLNVLHEKFADSTKY